MGIDVALIENPGLEDDAGLPLSQFPAQVSLTRYANDDSDMQTDLVTALGSLLGARLSRRHGWQCLVVKDLQSCLAEYGQ